MDYTKGDEELLLNDFKMEYDVLLSKSLTEYFQDLNNNEYDPSFWIQSVYGEGAVGDDFSLFDQMSFSSHIDISITNDTSQSKLCSFNHFSTMRNIISLFFLLANPKHINL